MSVVLRCLSIVVALQYYILLSAVVDASDTAYYYCYSIRATDTLARDVFELILLRYSLSIFVIDDDNDIIICRIGRVGISC